VWTFQEGVKVSVGVRGRVLRIGNRCGPGGAPGDPRQVLWLKLGSSRRFPGMSATARQLPVHFSLHPGPGMR
jgi:hypothetical protein